MVDAGDLFGSRNKNDEFQSAFLAEMTGEMGYDAIALGERDLNYGLPFLKEMIAKHGLPYTNANVRDTGTGELILPEYLIVERNGIKYGIVSVMDPRNKIVTMTAEEAVLQMEMLGHDFFFFLDGNSNKHCVVYNRRDGNVGLIEPA